jgi:two-component system NtrC family sensor kinase
VVDHRKGRQFSGGDVHLLELLAAQISISIRNARLFQELGERIKAQRAAEGRIVEAARLAAIGELAASIAHELNNPLTTITGFTELLLEDFPAGSRQRENMELVLSEARRAREVVRRLLDFSRREEDLMRPVNLTETVSEVLALTQPMATIQQVEIQFEAWDELPLVFGDRSKLRQVVQNLVTNAIQAMPDGGTLRIQTGIENGGGPESGKRAALSFRDTGIGIPEDHRSRVFEPFFTTKPVGSGTGLGLSISRNIISEHGGEIRLESEEGAGACFTVILPVYAENLDRSGEVQA